MLNLLVKPLLGVVADGVKGFVETKKAKQELAVTEIKAAKAIKEQQIAGKISWEASAVDQMKGSWKDELILICLLVPAVAVFIPGWTPHIKAGFEALHSLDVIHLVDRIYKIIRTRQNQITQLVISNQVKDWNEYQNHLGQLDTLNYIEQELTDLLKKKQEQNE
jgi:hypothetical protein